jgi:hypothetical protein
MFNDLVLKLTIGVALIAAAIVACTQTASAQQPPACVKHSELIAHLADKFQETPTHFGITDNGMLMEVYVSADRSTWTVAMTMPNGISCLVATGQMWETVPRAPASFGPPA